ncbi:MAG: Bax inhibitor-1/YccA family protein [Clostridiales bacterium]|nr:Bax inhibitor-1/YccA family protein [Clostridiales bacterium]
MEKSLERSREDFISKVITYMGVGLFVTFLTAYFTYATESLQNLIYSSNFVFLGLIIFESIIVSVLSSRIDSMTVTAAKFGFLLYSFLNGITFSAIFLVYTESSIFMAFLISSVTFVSAGLVGIVTKRDLGIVGRLALMTLFGIIVISILNMFLGLDSVDIMLSIVGLVTFIILTAYDMQKLKKIHYEAYEIDEYLVDKFAIIGALTLYLDFINIFLRILKFIGKKK